MRNLLSKVMAGKKKPKNGSEGSQANSDSAKPEPTEPEQPKEEVAIEAQTKVDSTPEAKAATEPTKEKAEPTTDPEPSKGAQQETNAEKDVRVVDEILSKLELNNPDYTTEEKLEALCLVFRETIAENVK